MDSASAEWKAEPIQNITVNSVIQKNMLLDMMFLDSNFYISFTDLIMETKDEFQYLGTILNLVFAVTTIIDTIATASIIAAITPNSGIAQLP